MVITRRIIWGDEDIGVATLISLVGDPGEKRWGLAISNFVISVHADKKEAEKRRIQLIRASHAIKIPLLMGLGPHVINLLKEGE